MLKKIFVISLPAAVLLFSCNNNHDKKTGGDQPETPIERRTQISYRLLSPKDSIRKIVRSSDSTALEVISAVNRADKNALVNFDTIVIPADTKQTNEQYFPFPFNAAFLKDVNKIIFFSYPAQSFAAYEHGRLVYTGPTSMGRNTDPTPTGLFYTNWKAEKSTSTFNDEWDLKWNFNIENKLGIGFHEYSMPGYPASHSCLRLKEKDAMYLYNWADQWKIEGTDNILTHGTPVIIFGSYPFGRSRPWLGMAQNPDILIISETDLENIGKQYLPDIMEKQSERSKEEK